MGPLVTIGFLILHLIGGAIAVVMLARAWEHRLLVQLLMERLHNVGPVLASTGAGQWLVPTAISLVVVLAALASGRILCRLRQRRPESHVLLRLRALFYAGVACVLFNALVLSTPESFSGPFRLRHPILGEISLAFAYGAYALWSLLLPLLLRTVSQPLRRGLDVFLMNAVLALVLAEVGLRAVAILWPSQLLVTDSTSSQIRREAGRKDPGTLWFGFPLNRGGHYDSEFLPRSERSGPLVVSIGDSFSYGMVPLPYHFTSVAERKAGVEIYNMGYPGTAPDDYLHLLEHVALPLEPDLLVVQLFLGNDVATRPEVSPTRWHDADRYLAAVMWYRLQILWRAEFSAPSDTASAFDPTRDELETRYPWLSDPLLEEPSMSSEVYSEMEQRQSWVLTLPHVGVYERFFEALEKLKKAAGEVPLAFVLIPDEFHVEDALWREIVSKSERARDRDLSQRKVVAWLGQRGLPFLDLLPVLRSAEPLDDGRRHVYHLRDTHFNARGNQLAGRALGRFVRELLSNGEVDLVEEEGASPSLLPLHLDVGGGGGRRFMQSGWGRDEAKGDMPLVWSEGMRSVLSVPLPTGGDIRMDLAASPFSYPNAPQQYILVLVNGTRVDGLTLGRGLQRYSVVLPGRLLEGSPTVVEFIYAYASRPSDVLPNSPDTRKLGVAWRSVTFVESEP